MMNKCILAVGSVLATVISAAAAAGGPDQMFIAIPAVDASAVPVSASVSAASVAPPSSASAWYAGMEGGMSILMGDYLEAADGTSIESFGDATSLGYDIGLTVGYSLTSNVSMEGQAFYISNAGKDALEDFTYNEHVFMGNVKYGVDAGNSITPYIGFGFGYIGVDTADESYGSDMDSKIGYQALIGTSYALNSQMDLTLDYHFVGAIGSQEFDGTTTKDLPKINMLNLGFNYQF